MQTFLPYPSFDESAKCLDYRRLGKQRVETLQILKALFNESKGWKNHPATKMWKGYEGTLVGYGCIMCLEWVKRGFNDTCFDKIQKYAYDYDLDVNTMPPWLGNMDFHASHRSNLLRKDKQFYSQYNWQEPDNLEYIWPFTENIGAILP